jgi:hypothetical protein
VGVEEKGFTVGSQVCSFFWERHVFVRMFGIATPYVPSIEKMLHKLSKLQKELPHTRGHPSLAWSVEHPNKATA